MKTVVYDLIEADLQLWDRKREVLNTYSIDSLVNGENKEILYRFALTIHKNRGGGEFYTSTDTFKYLNKPAILLQFNLPEDLQQAVTEDVIYRDHDINPRRCGLSNEFWAGKSRINEIFSPGNFAGFWYKPEAAKSDSYFVSAEDFKCSLMDGKSFADTVIGFFGAAPQIPQGRMQPAEIEYHCANAACTLL
ncbi:hypothetical protein [Legionella sp. 16cNR16C]|uniref:hypothetical protein n=1 Tax=Legionella sp. 16cNR16C TaxID=2905656 RepID=UPI001E411513|nr:hypothetical protein [Legionella sp. 16cNR16C]MCE3044327.1 hypothetical protein [Legionella sp. 16cNR16C]